MEQGGKRANQTGNVLEQVIEAVLRANGIEHTRQHRLGVGIYGTPLRADFYLPQRELIIETKWQEVSGSADEKLPYLLANIAAVYVLPTIIVYGGSGWRPGAIAWAKRALEADDSRSRMLSLEEFITWSGRNLRSRE